MLKKIAYAGIALLGINLIIAIHESGHFVACKIFNITTPEFSIGFGPLLASKKIGDTQFSLRLLPIGGYVQIAGMSDEDTSSDNFYHRPYYQKALVTLSGIICNIILAIAIFSIIPLHNFGHRLRTEVGLQRNFLGPIGIISVLMKSASISGELYWGFIGVLSANLAFINALPLPFLDGGHFVRYTLQALHNYFTLNEAQQAIILTALFVILMYMIYRSIRTT